MVMPHVWRRGFLNQNIVVDVIMTQYNVDFNAINTRALAQSETLLTSWLSGGKLQGREYVARNPTRQDAHLGSFKINVDTGKWLDGATGDQGGDFISLYAYLNSIDGQYPAAVELAALLGIATTDKPKSKPTKSSDGWVQVIDGVPDHAPKLPTNRNGKAPVARWAYRSATGQVVGYVQRFDHALQQGELKPKKDFYPLTLWSKGDQFEWRYKSLPAPRPLFNLNLLAKYKDADVVICEGEAACLSAGELLKDYIPTCNSNGSNSVNSADLTPLRNRSVLLWPDADKAGEKWLNSLLSALSTLNCIISVINTDGLDSSIGYDAKDAISDGWTIADIDKRIQPCVPNTKSDDNAADLSSLIRYDHNGKPSLVEHSIAADIIYLAQFKSLLYFDPSVREWYHYQECGIFKLCPELVIQQSIYSAIKEQTRETGFASSYVSGVASCLKYEAVKQPKPQSGLICFKNGVLNLKTRQLLPHSPDYFFNYQLPFDWIPDADHPKLVTDWLYEATGKQSDQVELIRAWFHAVIVGRPDLQRFLEVIGFGGSGKGTLLRLLCALIGHDAVHSTKIEHLENNRFETAKIFGKKLVVVTDAEKWHGDVSTLKSITGQDLIRFEEKNRQSGDSFMFAGMVMILANQHTASNDYSSGIQRRKITLKFDHVVAPEKRRDLDCEFEPLLANVAAWALDMPEQDVTDYLRSTTHKVKSLNETRLENLVATNPIAGWIDSSVVFDPAKFCQIGTKQKISVTTGDGNGNKETRTKYENQDKWLYPNYAAWCDRSGKTPISLNNFARTIVDVATTTLGKHFVKAKKQGGTGKAIIEGLALCEDFQKKCEGICEVYPIDCYDCEDCEVSKTVLNNEEPFGAPEPDPIPPISPISNLVGDSPHRPNIHIIQGVRPNSSPNSSPHIGGKSSDSVGIGWVWDSATGTWTPPAKEPVTTGEDLETF